MKCNYFFISALHPTIEEKTTSSASGLHQTEALLISRTKERIRSHRKREDGHRKEGDNFIKHTRIILAMTIVAIKVFFPFQQKLCMMRVGKLFYCWLLSNGIVFLLIITPTLNTYLAALLCRNSIDWEIPKTNWNLWSFSSVTGVFPFPYNLCPCRGNPIIVLRKIITSTCYFHERRDAT